MNDKKFILISFLIWRLALFIPVFLGNELITYPNSQWYTNILYLFPEKTYLENPLLFPWSNFDGVHYLGIAKNGYTSDGRFLPAYPYLIGLISEIFGFENLESYFWTGFFISNLFFFLALFLFYKLILLDFSKEKAFWGIIFLLTFPTSFFFGSLYSESIFLFFVIFSFYLVRKNIFFLLPILIFLISITRVVGLALVPALLFELYIQYRQKFNKAFLLKALLILVSPISLLFFSLFNYSKWNDALYFIHSHSLLGNSRESTSVVLFPQTIYRYFKILLTLNPAQYEWFVAALELLFFLFLIIICYLAIKQKIRTSYLIYSFIALIFPISSGTFSGLPRYLSIAFPIFITLALIKSSRIKILILTIFIILQCILLMFFSKGYFIA